MNLKSYYNKHVKIITDNGQMFIGFVDDYFFPEDNENGLESIALKTNDGVYEFNENDINKIEII